MSTPGAKLRRWTREEYERMVIAGIFNPEDRIELIEGEILEMSPQNSRHAAIIRMTEETLREVFAQGYDIRAQFPLALGEDSEPEPDIAVVPGRPRDYLDAHPTTAALVVEVADSSLSLDRQRKMVLYAAHNIPEYWLVNLVDARLEVYREPAENGYRSRQVLGREDVVSPLAHPQASIPVSELLP